jgi:molybdopterin molybdotransferase
MIPYSEAVDIINSVGINLKTETISLLAALDRVSSADIESKIDYPSEDNSAMDGYALNSLSTLEADSGVLKLDIDEKVIYAGDASKYYASRNSAVRIMTGGYLPETLDTVIPVENAIIEDKRLVFNSPLKSGQNVRKRGEDIKSGDIILRKNTRLTPENISLLISCNVKKIKVYEKLPLSIISTGNEILNFTGRPKYGKIYNSNGILAENFLLQNRCIVLNNIICKDNLKDIENAVLSAVKTSKIIITSAGASFGDKDFTGKALESAGFKVKFRQVAIKPAKPFTFGIINNKIPVFMLPGNPVAFYTCLVLFVKPFINSHIKINSPALLIKSKSTFEYTKKKGRREFLPAHIFFENGCVYSEIYKKTGPAMISSLGFMNSIVSIPENACKIAKGELLDAYLI